LLFLKDRLTCKSVSEKYWKLDVSWQAGTVTAECSTVFPSILIILKSKVGWSSWRHQQQRTVAYSSSCVIRKNNLCRRYQRIDYGEIRCGWKRVLQASRLAEGLCLLWRDAVKTDLNLCKHCCEKKIKSRKCWHISSVTLLSKVLSEELICVSQENYWIFYREK
jgi:hypothetical protein